MPGFYLTPFWICSARKTAKTLLLPIWQKFMMQNPLNFCRELFHYNLVDEFIVYLFPYSTGKGNSVQDILPFRRWQLHKAVAFSNGICRLIYRNPCKLP